MREPMKKKRATKKAAKPPPARRPRAGLPGRRAAATAPAPLQYKVVELSTVDEGALEAALNHWTRQGWTLDGVQFAMRESSKRPAMAFLFFTREGAAAEADAEAARERLLRLSEEGSPTAALAREARASHEARLPTLSAHERLARLAGLDEPEPLERGRDLEPEEWE